MQCTVSLDHTGVYRLAIEGELDVVTVAELRQLVDEVVNKGEGDVRVDLTRLRMIDSSGVGAIVSLYKRLRFQGRQVVVEGCRDQPLAIFRLLRLDRVLWGSAPTETPTAPRSTGAPNPGPYLQTAPDAGEAVKHAKSHGRGATLLIGAGCSASAGIRVASEVVEVVAAKFPRAYRRQPDKSYAALMGELTVGERHDLIAALTEGAVPNLAHRAIARLVAGGFVRRILTTNFDNLLPRACAEIGAPSFSYDFSTTDRYDPALVREPAIFYVHGRDGGFLQHHSGTALQQHDLRLATLIADSITGRPLLVVGYSGLSDPLFETLASVARFTYGLYWATFKRQLPDPHVTEKLLRPEKQAYFVPATDADEFFTDLCSFLDVQVS